MSGPPRMLTAPVVEVEVQTEWYRRRTASKTKATVVGDRLVLCPFSIGDLTQHGSRRWLSC
jgi:hypothetical protein